MERRSEEAAEVFMNVTGASELVALQTLEEHGGNLNEALDAHFGGGNRNILPSRENPTPPTFPQHDFMDMNNQMQTGSRGFLSPVLSAARNLNPFSLLDPNFRRSFLNGISSSAFGRHEPLVYHPGEVRGIPVEYEAGNEQFRHSQPRVMNSSRLYENDLEEDIIQATIEASKQEAEDSSGHRVQQRGLRVEDDEFSRALSLSIKTAEQEKVMREQQEKYREQDIYDTSNMGDPLKMTDLSGPRVRRRPQQIEDDEFAHAVSLSIKTAQQEKALHELQGRYREQNTHGTTDVEVPTEVMVANGRERFGSSSQGQSNQNQESFLFEDMEEWPLTSHRSNCDTGLESERRPTAEGDTLPQEPPLDDENAVTLVVRMPDGGRHGHRFLKSHKLQYLFDFIDGCRDIKPGTYRVVRAYPRRAFGADESLLTLNELGLTDKQEALFLELI